MPWCYFRSPASTLQQEMENGGMNLIDLAAKFRVVFLQNFGLKENRNGSLTAEWLNVWASLHPKTNPSHECSIRPRKERICFHRYLYMERQRQTESGAAFILSVYCTLRTVYYVDDTTGALHYAASTTCWLITRVGQYPQVNIAWWSQVSMVHGDSLHFTNECAVAYKSSERHGNMYGVLEAGHHVA
jgi:hypothetical protein